MLGLVPFSMRVAAIAAVAALMLTACGGSSSKHASSAVASDPPSSTTTASTATATVTASHAAKPAIRHRASHAQAQAAAVAAAARASARANAGRPHRLHPLPKPLPASVRARVPHIRIKAKPPSPAAYRPVPTAVLDCMSKAAMSNVGRTPTGVAAGFDPKTGEPVYVKGPYKTAGAAAAAVRSLQGANWAQAGGLYVAYSPLTDHLDSKVQALASCLSRPPRVKKYVF